MNIFRKALRRSGGFTLIEILIVMGLMGVFVAVLLPDFNRIIPEMKVDKAAAKLSADLRLAQQKAVAEMSDVWFRIEIDNNRYYAQVVRRDLNSFLNFLGGSPEYMEDPLKGGAYLLVDLDELDAFKGTQLVSITSSSGPVLGWIRYTPLGSVNYPGADFDILIRHKVTGYQRTVHVTFPLGKISLP